MCMVFCLFLVKKGENSLKKSSLLLPARPMCFSIPVGMRFSNRASGGVISLTKS